MRWRRRSEKGKGGGGGGGVNLCELFVCGRFGISEERQSGRANEGKETENNRPSSVPKPTFIMLWKMKKTFSLQNYLGPWQAGFDTGRSLRSRIMSRNGLSF
jgi:hypothetical protein